jgi:hypothetical protein
MNHSQWTGRNVLSCTHVDMLIYLQQDWIPQHGEAQLQEG